MTGGRKPRVVMISPHFHPYVGGAERQALELSKALHALGVKVTVLTRGKPGLAAEESIGGIAVRRLRAPGPGFVGSLSFMISVFFWLWAHAFEWDVAHVHLAGSQALAAALAGKFLMRPVVVKIGGGRGIGEIAVSSKTFLGRLKLKALKGLKPQWVAVTNDLAMELGEHGFDKDSGTLHIIPNGVDIHRFQPVSAQQKLELRKSWGWPEQAFCCLYVGRLAAEKRLDAFIRCLSELADDPGRKIFLALAGAGPERSRLEREVQAGKAEDRARFHAPVEAVERLYQAADAFVLPSISEGLSNALLEAMSCGLPVLASRVGGTAETVEDGASGILFGAQDSAAMKEGLRRLSQSPEAAQAMGRRGREKAQADFDLRKVAEQYLNLYRS